MPASQETDAGQGACILTASACESGQKLLQFLTRRLKLPPALLHRWIRTGQIRVNGGRCKPFVRVYERDAVRLPPFARDMVAGIEAEMADALPRPEKLGGCGLKFIGAHDGLWAIDKPCGLPVHPGSGHADSVSSRLAACYAGMPWTPAPIHRLDRDTGGVLLVAAVFAAANMMRECRQNFHREYLARVSGSLRGRLILRNYLRKEMADGQEKMRVYERETPGAAQAVTIVRPLEWDSQSTLVQALLLTGRTHQVRAQLAHAGFPIIGDGKYAQPDGRQLRLHACRVVLPDLHEFVSRPVWAASELPPPLEFGVHEFATGG